MTPHVHATRSDWVEEQLRWKILSGELPPGTRVHVNQLAGELSVSQTPLRESIQRLAIQGLIEIRPQRGAHVVGVDIDECHDIYQLRLLLEPLAIRQAIENEPSVEWDREVEHALDALATAFSADPYDHSVGSRAHMAFHRRIIEPCGSGWLVKIIEQLQMNSARYRTMSLKDRGGLIDAIEEHREIADACRRRDADLAAQLICAHLQQTIDIVTQLSTTTPQVASSAVAHSA